MLRSLPVVTEALVLHQNLIHDEHSRGSPIVMPLAEPPRR